jgi:two-component system cell cycle response regulator
LLKQSAVERAAHVSRGRVLVVDDSKTIRVILCTYLKTHGFEVAEAGDGEAALRCLEAGEFDVIVTDLMMPALDGFGLIEAIKARDVPAEIILVTNNAEQDAVVRALRLGAHDFLTKPLPGADAVVLTVTRALEKKRLKDTNARLMRELAAQSRRDGLTGLLNRRVFDESLAQELVRARRYDFPLCLAMVDIDHFKRVNDACGHPAGDEVLRQVARRLESGTRQSDQVFRYGGEEFAVLFAHTPLQEAAEVCARLLVRLRATPIDASGSAFSITASIGLACAGGEADASDALVERADQALYQAKADGRNRVVLGGAHAARGAAGQERI